MTVTKSRYPETLQADSPKQRWATVLLKENICDKMAKREREVISGFNQILCNQYLMSKLNSLDPQRSVSMSWQVRGAVVTCDGLLHCRAGVYYTLQLYYKSAIGPLMLGPGQLGHQSLCSKYPIKLNSLFNQFSDGRFMIET